MAKEETGFVTAAHVLYRLAEIESEGYAFYKGLYEGAENGWVRKLAEKMMRAEQRHRARFLEYAQRADDSADPDDNKLTAALPPEVARLLNTHIFASGERTKAAARYASDADAIKVAIYAEECTALLLTQLRSFVSRSQKAYITRVIKEEWNHKARLEEVRDKHFRKKKN